MRLYHLRLPVLQGSLPGGWSTVFQYLRFVIREGKAYLMSIDTRLSRLMPALSARERAALIVRAFKDDEPENPAWRRTMPRDQADEFRRLIGLENAVASPLSSLIASLKKEVEKMAQKVTLIEELCNWDYNVIEIEEAATLVLQGVAPEAPGVAELRLLMAKPYLDREGGRGELQAMIDARVAELQAYVQFFWKDMRAIELVVEEVAAELGGEDPLRPLFRELLEHSKTGLTYHNQFLEALGSAVELQEPEEAELANLRARVERNAG